MTEHLTPDQMAEARTHAERMLRGWSPPALQWSQLGNAARIAMAFLQHLAAHDSRVSELLEANNREVERRREAEARCRRFGEEDLDENHAIYTLTDQPRDGFTLRQEIRAQHEELSAERDGLRADAERWKAEVEDWERCVKEFGYPIAPDHDHHEVRDWLNDAFAAGQAAKGDWQPIETAPKDGRPILIWQPDRNPKPNDGKCDDERYAIGYRRPDEWLKASVFGNRNSSTVNATHWMPLPDPPPAPDGEET